MLDLTKDNSGLSNSLEKEKDNFIMLMRDIVKVLSEAKNKAKFIEDNELQYLISVALESAQEKLVLRIYENS